ncbi:hypothetical protein GYMLUDRAFT_170982 [Collybiopsis luxurians FD-317 M1]|uniref:Uncharacterized protein n=1 Tax=Collybiopsis luxurians FD-317 M1 TaxID=944289 RepID=A0A0D0BT09_9AGAR|nr:hypothetical protein GYMLUDRAFT_170982 [Collybiopsis luxurians FD-317 M1]
MAILCQHDYPLWVVNMTTPGEAQHYTLTLLAKLFKHLPPNVLVQILYNITCQLHCSCIKWSFLKPYMSWSYFAIFHVFGHQWLCQVIYHPQKAIGFDLSDGVGTKRLWHSISHLIAYGQVMGMSFTFLGVMCN